MSTKVAAAEWFRYWSHTDPLTKRLLKRFTENTKMTDDQIEQEIQAKGLTAPRVTPADIEANIAHEWYFRPGDAGIDALRFQFLTEDHQAPEIRLLLRELSERLPSMSTSAVRQYIDLMMAIPGNALDQLNTLTFCVLTLRNGFTVTGESACASPENFDGEVGRKIARANAINKVWPLMGYELRSKLAEASPQ